MDRLVFAIYRLASAAILACCPSRAFFAWAGRSGRWPITCAGRIAGWCCTICSIAFRRGEIARGIARHRPRAFRHARRESLLQHQASAAFARGDRSARHRRGDRDDAGRRHYRAAGFVMVISHIGSWEMFAQLSPIIFGCKVGHDLPGAGQSVYRRRGAARSGAARAGTVRAQGRFCEGLPVHARGRRASACSSISTRAMPACGARFSAGSRPPPRLPATLALRTDAWLVPAAVYTEGVARWRCVILGQMKPQGQDAEHDHRRINEMLEEQIRRAAGGLVLGA